MGAKTALFAVSEGDIRPALLGATKADRDEAEEVVREAFPGYKVRRADDSTLESTMPPENIAYATVLAGAELLCDQRLVFEHPSRLPAHLRTMGAGRRIIMHAMHSVVDWLGFAVWEDGELVRSLSLWPDGGIVENIGEPMEFELPYWAGEHSIEDHPLPFDPLEMGEDALRELFGFVIEGIREPDDINPDEVHLHGFLVTQRR